MKSIIQNGKYCYETKKTNCQLHKHHIFNGPLRDWSEANGLWVYLAYDIHGSLHDSDDGEELKNTLKRIGQYYYEKEHNRIEFLVHTHKNYLTTPLTKEEREKYCIEPEELDLNSLVDVEKLFGKNIKNTTWKI